MIDKLMIDEIIDLLPSADLKSKIAETDHRFAEEELLQIIYRYAPTFDTRLTFLGRFAEIASPDVSAWAKTYIEYEQNKLKRFVEVSEKFIYELHIKVTPESYEEHYICSSYNAALVCIDRFYEHYADIDAKETDKTRYRILKRKILSERDAFEEDTYAECVLGASKTVLNVSDYNDPMDCDLDNSCSECKEICPRRCDELYFPCYAHDCAVIKYSDYDGKDRFGVCLCDENCCNGSETELYVIPLDSSAMREHLFDEYFYDHMHIELPCATLATPEELDETMRKNYFEFVEYRKSEKSK